MSLQSLELDFPVIQVWDVAAERAGAAARSAAYPVSLHRVSDTCTTLCPLWQSAFNHALYAFRETTRPSSLYSITSTTSRVVDASTTTFTLATHVVVTDVNTFTSWILMAGTFFHIPPILRSRHVARERQEQRPRVGAAGHAPARDILIRGPVLALPIFES